LLPGTAIPSSMDDLELEQIIAKLVQRKGAPGISDAEFDMLDRVLDGLCRRYGNARPIWEDLDHHRWP